MARKQARAAAVQMVYEQMMGGDGGEDTLRGLIAFTPEEDDQAFVDGVLNGVSVHQDEIDRTIAGYLRDWTLDRIARVDLAVLRVAVYELCYLRQTPDAVVINEAVALAQRFDSPQAGKFINGVLSSVLGGKTPETQEENA